ncbi:hypothetical protein BJ508DRAFT_417382, partial [Ascobolus immersus RN42]
MSTANTTWADFPNGTWANAPGLEPGFSCKHFECYDPGNGEEILWPNPYLFHGDKYMPQNIPRAAPEFICELVKRSSLDKNATVLSQNTPTLRTARAVGDARRKCHEVSINEVSEFAWRRWPSGRELMRGNCVDHCDNLFNGTFITEANKAWEKECMDHDPVRNRPFLEFVRDEDIEICKGLLLPPAKGLGEMRWECDVKPGKGAKGADMPSCEDSVVVKEGEKCLEDGKGKSKEACADYCEMAYNGTMMASLWECWDEGCSDAREGKNEAVNDVHLEMIVKGNVESVCKPLGIKGAKPWYNTEWRDEPKGEQEAKDEDEKNESGAAGFGAKKGAVLLAVVMGALFSGM